MEDSVEVEVAYALPRKQIVKVLTTSSSMTVEDVIKQSKILEEYPEIQLKDGTIGIFGKAVKLSQCVKAHDRIEIYRPLINDPKELRRRRAAEN